MLSEDRYFDAETTVRAIARELYDSVKGLPIVSPHGHVDPALFAENRPFTNPVELFLIPDHYLQRMLHSQGIPLAELGVPDRQGRVAESDPRKIWKRFADSWYLFAGTPSAQWLAYEFSELFGLDKPFGPETADFYYDTIEEKLRTPEYLPRALFDRFNIDVLATTDSATDDLAAHQQISASGWKGRVIPTFRPDALTNPRHSDWHSEVVRLGEITGIDVGSFAGFIKALEARREEFRRHGATSTDHAVVNPLTRRLEKPEAVYSRLIKSKGNPDEETSRSFEAHMLMEMARMSVEDGMVMQLHPGSFRNHDSKLFENYGPDCGADIPIATEYTRNLRELLNAYGNEPNFTFIVFTLDESSYSRELAPLAGYYSSMRLGPAWWFHDSIEGMNRFRDLTADAAGYWNTVGFNDDTRALPSIPARHDLARRVDCNHLARRVAKKMLTEEEARRIARALAYDLAKNAYKL